MASWSAVLTHLGLKVFPFVLVPAVFLLGLLLVRSLLPPSVPAPPMEQESLLVEARKDKGSDEQNAQPSAQQQRAPDTSSPQDDEDLLADAQRLKENGRILEKFEEPEHGFVLRLLLSTGDSLVSDEKELESVSGWVQSVRKLQSEFVHVQKMQKQLSSLASVVDHRQLFELGLLDAQSFAPSSEHPQFQPSEEERIGAAQRAINDALGGAQWNASDGGVTGYKQLQFDVDNNGRVTLTPDPQGRLRLISPREKGYRFLHLAQLKRHPAPPLTCQATWEVVKGYVQRSGDRSVAKSFQLLRRQGPELPNLAIGWNRSPSAPDLRAIDEAVLAGEVGASTAQRLARYRSFLVEVIKEYADYVAHQQKIGRLMRHTLRKAHAALKAKDDKELAAYIQRLSKGTGSPYIGVRTPRGMSRAQRREEILRFVQAAIPAKKMDF